jgi:RNA polymerase sigma-70 factor (ECF subfamily)
MEQIKLPRAPSEGAVASPSDGSLLRRFIDGNQDAARAIYERYAHRLRALARARCSPDLANRLDVEDIVQSVFGSFFRAASRGYYDVPAGEELWKLFLAIALNKIRATGAFHRAAKRDVRLTTSEAEADGLFAALSTGDKAEENLVQLTIADFLEALSPQQQAIVRLRIEGFEVAEVAAKTGRARRTVERVLQDVRRRLSDLMQAEKT